MREINRNKLRLPYIGLQCLLRGCEEAAMWASGFHKSVTDSRDQIQILFKASLVFPLCGFPPGVPVSAHPHKHMSGELKAEDCSQV